MTSPRKEFWKVEMHPSLPCCRRDAEGPSCRCNSCCEAAAVTPAPLWMARWRTWRKSRQKGADCTLLGPEEQLHAEGVGDTQGLLCWSALLQRGHLRHPSTPQKANGTVVISVATFLAWAMIQKHKLHHSCQAFQLHYRSWQEILTLHRLFCEKSPTIMIKVFLTIWKVINIWILLFTYQTIQL